MVKIPGFILGTFGTIEAVLTAVNSIADMLNTTHHAVFSSFQAVIGAFDEFSKLKTQVCQVITVGFSLKEFHI